MKNFFWPRSRLVRAFFITSALVLASCAATFSGRTELKVDISDPVLPQGGVAVFRLSEEPRGLLFASRASRPWGPLSAEFTGGAVRAFEARGGAWGILAVDIETAPGPYELSFNAGQRSVKTIIEVVKEDYGTERLKLPKHMVEFDKKTLKRIRAEARKMSMLWSDSYPEPLFNVPFIMPVDGRVSGKFGTKRILNGSPRSPHSGMDFAAPAGTAVKAANSGRVAFVGDFFFSGRFVVIDHGLGVFSSYSHLSAIDVKAGQLVERGTVVGSVGATGRATGPHLHFAVVVGGKRVSPVRLFEVTERLLDSLPQAASKGPTSG